MNPTGRGHLPSFAELVESAFAEGQGFDEFLNHALKDEWNISPETFRNTIIHNLNNRLARHNPNAAKPPYAMQRYEQSLAEGAQTSASRPAVPTETIIANWINGISKPTSTQMTLLSCAFDLSIRQEHMLWKSLQGRKLGLQQVRQAIKTGNSGVLGSLLVRSSGFPEPRLAELIEVPDTTLHSWADRHTPRHIHDMESAGKFAKVLTQCLDMQETELKPWQLSMLQRDITSVMTGHDQGRLPSSPMEAAVRFQQLFEESYEKGESFDQFLAHALKEWDVSHTYLDFLNKNNAKDNKDYEPLTERMFHDWVHNQEKPRTGRVEKIASGAFMSLEQELKLWKMIHGKTITAEEVQTDIAAGNSGKMLSRLIDASGIGRSRILAAANTDTNTLSEWMNPETPRPVYNSTQAGALADMLLPLVVWDKPPPPEDVEVLRRSFMECATGRKTHLYDIVLEAVGHEKPHAKLVHLLCDKTELSNADLAEKLGITTSTLNHYKSGGRVCSEADAHKFINLAGSSDELSVLEAVNVLTQTRSPPELLNLAEQGKLWIGKVYEETSRRRHIPRSYMQDAYGISNHIMSNFEEEAKGKHLNLEHARRVADFIGFRGDERRRFVLLAAGQKMEKVQAILSDAEALVCKDGETLKRLIAQTTLPDNEIIEIIGVPPQKLADFCSGEIRDISFAEGGLAALGNVLGLAADSPDMARLQKLFTPGPDRILHLVEKGHMKLAEGLKRLMDIAAVTPQELGLAARSASALLEDPQLPAALKILGERLKFTPSEQASLQMTYAAAHRHSEDGFVSSLNQQRKQVIGDMMGGVMNHRVEWENMVTDSAPLLEIWDAFANNVYHGKQPSTSFALARSFLAGEPTSDNEILIGNAFKAVAQEITNATSPEKGVSAKQFQGVVYDAINKLLFQRLCGCRRELGLPDIADGPDDARAQKKLLLAHPTGKKALAAVMAINNGYIAQLAAPLRKLPEYQDKAEMDAAIADLWMGTESSDPDKQFVGGGLAAFLRWNPLRSRFSTYVTMPVENKVMLMTKRAQRGRDEYSNCLESTDENAVSGIDDYSYRKHQHDSAMRRETPGEIKRQLEKVREVLELMEPRERRLLQAIFEGIVSGEHPTLESLAPLVSNSSEPVTRERVRQLRVKAYTEFMDTWKSLAEPGDELPADLGRFLEMVKDRSDNNTHIRR